MLVLVPPHGDPSLALVPGREVDAVVDAGRAFVAGVLDGSVAASAPGANAALLIAAGRQAAAAGRPPLGRLRGLGTLLAGLDDEGFGVRLRLDDLELAAGSTERGADVVAAAGRPAPYDAALGEAIEATTGARHVRLVVERDQQLPAAARAAAELTAQGVRVELTGRFATQHWEALRALTPFEATTLAPTPSGLHWRVAALPGDPAAPPDLDWRDRAADPRPPGRWAGRLSLRELVERTGEVGDAHTVVVGLCATRPAVIGRGGFAANPRRLGDAVSALCARGVRVVAELWVGAPGVTAAEAEQAAADAPELGLPVVGLRAFDWPVGWTSQHWGEQRVRWRETPDLDLARQRVLEEPACADPRALVATIGPGLAREGSLLPGRVAGSYLLSPPRLRASGERLVADPDIVVVHHAAAGDGRVVAVNLRIGRLTALDESFGRALDSDTQARPVATAIANLPERGREQRIGALLSRGVLAWEA